MSDQVIPLGSETEIRDAPPNVGAGGLGGRWVPCRGVRELIDEPSGLRQPVGHCLLIEHGPSGAVVKTVKIGSAIVLTNAQGRTLYWFAPDTATVSKCTSTTCVHFWPVVKGIVTACRVDRQARHDNVPDGLIQATYSGHPLYTYIGDTASGQAKGNGLNLSGGLWHEVTVSGAAAPGLSPSSSPGGSGY